MRNTISGDSSGLRWSEVFLIERGQQQVLRPTFEGIRDSVRELIGKQMDALARKFAATHNKKVKAD